MKRISWVASAAIACVSAVVLLVEGGAVAAQQGSGSANRLTAEEQAQGWRLLFDGTSLNGWTKNGTADWLVEDGVITFKTGRGTLQTADSYENFQLRVDFWGERTANSGVFVRLTPRGQANAFYEINIFDTHATAPTGSILAVDVGKAPAPIMSTLPKRYDTAEKWNAFEILAKGPQVQVKLNGAVATDTSEDPLKLGSGPIQLQAGGPDGPGIVRFRNIRIKTL